MTNIKVDYAKALTIAQGELSKDVKEITANWSPDIKQYLSSVGISSPAAWCAAFLNHCFKMAGGCPWSSIEYPAYVPAIKTWANRQGLFKLKGVTTPKAGDLVIFSDGRAEVDHIGMVESLRGDKLITIEGNTSPPNGVGPDGLYRREHKMTSSWVHGFIVWPVYDVAQPKQPNVYVNGQLVGTGKNDKGTVFVPVAALARALGADVVWDHINQAVRVTNR